MTTASRQPEPGPGERSPRGKSLLALHGSVALFGFSGLLGKVASSPPIVVTCVRSLIAAAVLGLGLVLQRRFGRSRLIGLEADRGSGAWRLGALLGLGGALLAVHWWAFFATIQRSTVALGLLTFASYPLFATLLEPLFFQERLRGVDALACVGVMLGLALVVPSYDFGTEAGRAAGLGISSGLTFALLSLMNRRLTRAVSPLMIVTAQTGVAGALLLPLAAGALSAVTRVDWLWLVVLGIVFTALAHWAFTASLQSVSVRLAGITAALEPVYGIAGAWLLLGERPGARTLVGGATIIAATCLGTLVRRR